MALPLDGLLLLAAGLAMLLLATLVLAVGIGRPLHRAFAALLAARGLTTMLPQVSTDPHWTQTALMLQPYFALAVAPLAAYLLVRVAGRGPRHAGWLAIGVIVLLDGLYALDHALFHSVAPGQAAVGAMQATADLQYTAFGPLMVVAGTGPVLLAALGLTLAARYRRVPDAPDSKPWLLVAIGLLAGALFDGANRLAALADLMDGAAAGFAWLPWGWGILVLPAAGVLPAFIGAAVLAGDRSMDPRPLHRIEGLGLVLFALAFFSGFLRLVAPASSDIGGSPVVLVLLGAWRLVMPALVASALLRREHAVGERSALPGPAEA